MQANKRQNGVYTELLETKDELATLAEKLKMLERNLKELEELERMRDEAQQELEC